MAQVEWKDPPVTLAPEDQKNHSIARPSNADYTVIVWEDYRNGHSDIFAQMIENSNGVAMWFPIDGVPVCTAPGEQRNPRAVYDTLGGIIITWEDYRYDNHSQFDPVHSLSQIYAQRILLSTGEFDQNWSGMNMLVSGNTLSLTRNPRLVGIGDGAVITWTDYRNASQIQNPPYYTNLDVYANYVLSSGGLYWGSEINVPSSINYDQRNPEIVLDSIKNPNDKVGVIIAYEDNRTGEWQIFADRIEANGNRIWGDLQVAPPTNANVSDPHQLNLRMVHVAPEPPPNGGGGVVIGPGVGAPNHRGVIITWQDERHRNLTQTDIYAQRVDIEAQNGESLWPTTGNPYGTRVCDSYGDQTYPKIDVGNRNAIIAWEDGRNMQDLDIYANRVDVYTGLALSSAGDIVCSEQEDQRRVEIEYVLSENRATLCWEDWREVYFSDIYVQEIEPSQWAFLLQSNGLAVTKAKTDQVKPEVGSRVIVYTDERRDPIAFDTQDDANIFAQKLGDECNIRTGMNWNDVLAKWTLGTDVSDHRFAVDDDGCAYVVWREDRVLPQYLISEPGIYIQKFDKDGVPRWKNGGILISDPFLLSEKPDVCIDGTGGAIAAWHEVYNGAYRVVVKKVDYSGNILWTAYPPISGGSEGKNPRVVENDNCGAYVAYEEVGNAVQTYGIDNIGQPMFLFPIPLFPGSDSYDPLISKDRQGGCYTIGRSFIAPFHIILASHVDPTGISSPGIIQAFTAGFGGYDLATDIIANGNEFDGLLASSNGTNIYAQKLVLDRAKGLVEPEPDVGLGLITFGTLGNTFYTLPAIDYDSVAGNFGGGAIIAYDYAQYYPQTGLTRHCVETNRIIWADACLPPPSKRLVITGIAWSNPPTLPIGLSQATGCLSPTYPDIAKRRQLSPLINSAGVEAALGVVVWQDDSYSSCSNMGILAQEVDYALPNTLPHQPRQWPQHAEISPKLNGEQSNPIILRAAGDSLTIFWKDVVSGNEFIAGSNISTKNGDMVVSKRYVEKNNPAPSFINLDQNWPNPVSISGGQGTIIKYTIAEEGDVSLKLYDILGREAAVLAQGFRAAGTHTELFEPVNLAPGLYIYALACQNRLLSRTMIIVK